MGDGVPASAVTVHLDCGGKTDAAVRADNGWPITCTEVRNLMSYDGRVFVGTGLWTYTPTEGDPPDPGCAIMRLQGDEPVIEHSFTGADTAVSLLHVAQFKNYTVPIASTWKKARTDIYYRDHPSSSWHFAQELSSGDTTVKGQPQVRCAYNFTDPETDVSLLFLGHTNGIYSLGHDPDARGGLGRATLELDVRGLPPTTTGGQPRVMSMSEMSGRLYATAWNRLYERENGVNACWHVVHEDPDIGTSDSGLRGLTHGGTDPGYFFVGRESDNHAILKLVRSAEGKWTQTVAYDCVAELSKAWSELYGADVKATYGIPAYNTMTWFQPPGTSHWALWIGFESLIRNPPPNVPIWENTVNDTKLMALGCYLVFNYEKKGEWRLNHLPPVTSQSMVACRCGLPFGERFYIGGMDCNSEPCHNSGFLVSLEAGRLTENAVA
jgi:hypothetical protein